MANRSLSRKSILTKKTLSKQNGETHQMYRCFAILSGLTLMFLYTLMVQWSLSDLIASYLRGLSLGGILKVSVFATASYSAYWLSFVMMTAAEKDEYDRFLMPLSVIATLCLLLAM